MTTKHRKGQTLKAYMAEQYRETPGLREAVAQLGPFESPGLMAAAIEFVLEGLHLHQKLNKDRAGGRYTYRA